VTIGQGKYRPLIKHEGRKIAPKKGQDSNRSTSGKEGERKERRESRELGAKKVVVRAKTRKRCTSRGKFSSASRRHKEKKVAKGDCVGNTAVAHGWGR